MGIIMKLRIISLLFLFLSLNLCAEISDYFKKFPDKSGFHAMRNIDFVCMINLDQRPEKFAHSLEQLEPYGVHPCRFSAVNGWELSPTAIDSLGVKYEASSMLNDLWATSYLVEHEGKPFHQIMQIEGRNYYCHCMSRGAIGIVLSHLSILQDALESGYETIWVMEDDIEVLQDPNLISDRIEKLDALVGKTWDVLFTDRDTKNNQGEYVPCLGYARRPNFIPQDIIRFSARHLVSSEFVKIGARYGAYSMIIRRSGMEKILNFITQYGIFLPYDMEFYLPNDISMYTVIGDIISFKPGSPSDNGGPNYIKKKK